MVGLPCLPSLNSRLLDILVSGHVLTWTPKVAKAVTETENSVPAWLSLAPIILARDLACWRYTGPRSYGFHEDTVTANSAKALAFNAVTFCGFTVLLIHSEG